MSRTRARVLVVNADDFGLSAGVNDGIIAAHDTGIVTSASLMVHGAAAESAARLAQDRPQLGVGLHIDLVEWRFDGSNWLPVYRRVALDDAVAVEREVRAQLDRFRRLMRREPTHLDSHQHVHRREPARAIVVQIGRELGVPVRHLTEGIHYRGDFYGQNETGETIPDALRPEHLMSIIAGLRDAVTEICCHPAARVDFVSAYAAERLAELNALRDSRVRDTVAKANLTLVGFTPPRAPPESGPAGEASRRAWSMGEAGTPE